MNGVYFLRPNRLLVRWRIATCFAPRGRERERERERDNTPAHTHFLACTTLHTAEANYSTSDTNRPPTHTPDNPPSQPARCPQQCLSRRDRHTAVVLPHALLHRHVMGSRISLRTQSARRRNSIRLRPPTTRRSLHILAHASPQSVIRDATDRSTTRRSRTTHGFQLRPRPTILGARHRTHSLPNTSTPTTQLSLPSPFLPARLTLFRHTNCATLGAHPAQLPRLSTAPSPKHSVEHEKPDTSS